ncbi:MAG: Crp/Fnr family transcriptional regulator [Lewinella sp.]
MFNLENSKKIKVSKGQILLAQGDIATFGYKVESGCLKSYVIDKAGKEHILQFAPEGWVISDLDSASNSKPTVVFIDAIENSEVSLIAFADFGNFHQLEKGLLAEMSTKLRNNLVATNRRVIGLLSATAEERYIEFTQTYPTLVQRIPLKLIASYIGITPEYLSELRRKLAKKRRP